MSLKKWFTDKLEEFESDPEFILEGLLLEINEIILESLEKKGLSKKEFAEELNVSPAYVTKLLNGNPNLTLKSLIKIATVLDAKLYIGFEDISNVFKLDIPEVPEYMKRFKIKAIKIEKNEAIAA